MALPVKNPTSRLSLGLQVLFSLAMAFGSAQQAQAKADKVDPAAKSHAEVVVFHEDSSAMGKFDLYLCEQGARFEAKRGGIVAVCSAPRWDVALYSTKKKAVYWLPQSSVRSAGLGVFNAPIDFFGVKLHPYRDSILHITTNKAVIDSSRKQLIVTDSFLFQSRRNRALRDTTFRLVDGYKLAPRVQDFLHWLFNQRVLMGVPVELSNTYMDGSAETIYKARSIEKMTVPVSMFAYPQGLARVNDKVDILVTDEAKTTLEDLFGGSGGEQKKGH